MSDNGHGSNGARASGNGNGAKRDAVGQFIRGNGLQPDAARRSYGQRFRALLEKTLEEPEARKGDMTKAQALIRAMVIDAIAKDGQSRRLIVERMIPVKIDLKAQVGAAGPDEVNETFQRMGEYLASHGRLPVIDVEPSEPNEN